MEIDTESWRAFGDVAFLAVAASAGTFAILYLVLSPWWKTPAGRNIMAVMGILAAMAIYFAWVIHRGGVPTGFWPARAILFTAFAAAISWRVVIFVRAQVLARQNEKEKQDHETELR